MMVDVTLSAQLDSPPGLWLCRYRCAGTTVPPTWRQVPHPDPVGVPAQLNSRVLVATQSSGSYPPPLPSCVASKVRAKSALAKRTCGRGGLRPPGKRGDELGDSGDALGQWCNQPFRPARPGPLTN